MSDDFIYELDVKITDMQSERECICPFCNEVMYSTGDEWLNQKEFDGCHCNQPIIAVETFNLDGTATIKACIRKAKPK
jgi:hypothetical protein